MQPTPIPCSEIKGKVHVAIITIRQDEYEAMESRLGNSTAIEGNNNYELATIHPADQAPVSVVLTRCVAQGNTSATRLLTISSPTSIRRGFFWSASRAEYPITSLVSAT